MSAINIAPKAKQNLKRVPDSLLAQIVANFLRHPTGRIGVALVVTASLVAIIGPLVMPIDPFTMYRGQEVQAPSMHHPLGTDEYGRDLLSRTIHGLALSLKVAGLAVVLGGTPGVLSGLVTGYSVGWFSSALMRLWDGLLAFPTMLLAITLATILGAGPLNAAVALGIISMPQFSRIVRASVLVERQKDYVLAAHCCGARAVRIIWRHILPNVVGPVLVQITLAMGYAILLEAGLSFLGLGIQPPNPSLGGMLNLSRNYLYQAWWYTFFPGAAIVVLLLGLNWVSEALSDILDPRAANR